MIAEELREAKKTYPEAWLRDAIREAANHNKRKWSYISAILRTLVGQREGPMEHIGEILKRQTRTNTSKENTDTWSKR